MPKSHADYQSLSVELDTILTQMQQPDISVDEAVQLYEQGLAVAAKLETYVTQAENTLEKVRLAAAAKEA